MKKFKKALVSILVIGVLGACLTVPAFAAGSTVYAYLGLDDTIAYAGETTQSHNSAHVTGTVYAESKHGVEYRAKSKKNGSGGWFTRRTFNFNDSALDQYLDDWAAPLGNDCWTLEIEPNGPLFTNCRAEGRLSNTGDV
ncbi:MAG TPA: hypothetical protein IAB39_10740 [Candidatus Onthovicinus excrementipullorum]|nr:hypothetical protein [Candidatus Onthovicinus excrementipullorum]